MSKNMQVLLASRPKAGVSESNFQIVERDIPTPGPGEVLVRNHWLSLDPYMRGRMNASKSYAAGVEIGDVMTGGTVGEVIESNHPRHKVGDFVVGNTGWQLYAAAAGETLNRVDPDLVPLSAYLGVVGMPGATAWIGLFEHCQPVAGETLVVSAASGAVGGVVGQLGGPAPGPFGEIAFRQCLHAPDNSLDEPCLVPSVGRLAEHLGVLGPQVPHWHAV